MYTSIFDSTMFDALKADVMTGVSGWLGVALAVAGAAIIVRVLLK